MQKQWDKKEVKVYLLRKYEKRMDFCYKHKINHLSFNTWLAKPALRLPRIEEQLKDAILKDNYDLSLCYK
jgi:hypothetical protein